MSSETLGWALKVKMDRAALKLVLITVADIANHDTTEVFPSIRYVMEVTGLSKPTVLRALEELSGEEWGILERTEERRGKTNQIPVYLFHMPDSVQLIEKPGQKRTGKKSDPLAKGSNSDAERGQLFGGKEVKNLTTEPRRRNLEDDKTPPQPSVGTPPEEDLFGENDLVEQPVDLIDHVKAGWAALKADYPRTHGIAVLNDSRKAKIRRRAREFAKANGVTEHRAWDMLFEAVRNDSWLRGEGQAGRNHSKPFALDIDKVLATSGAASFLIILEKAQTNEHDLRSTSDPRTGREFGPAEQGGRRAISRLRAAGAVGGR